VNQSADDAAAVFLARLVAMAALALFVALLITANESHCVERGGEEEAGLDISEDTAKRLAALALKCYDQVSKNRVKAQIYPISRNIHTNRA